MRFNETALFQREIADWIQTYIWLHTQVAIGKYTLKCSVLDISYEPPASICMLFNEKHRSQGFFKLSEATINRPSRDANIFL